MNIFKPFIAVIALLLVSAPVIAVAQESENFDGVTVPALPADWSASGSGDGSGFETSAASSASAPNALRQLPGDGSGDWVVVSRSYNAAATTVSMSFARRHAYEPCCDGMRLAVSINGGAFQDILAAGGAFTSGPYDVGEDRWFADTGGSFVTTSADLPVSVGDVIRFRWQSSSDGSVISAPVYIDNVVVTGVGAPAPVPTMSEWAMILFGTMLAGGAALYLQRRRQIV